MRRIALLLAVGLLPAAGGAAPPGPPAITEPDVDGKIISPADLHMEASAYLDPDGQAHASTDWEVWRRADNARVWSATGIGDPLLRVHIHLADGTFEGPYAGRRDLEFSTGYLLKVRFRDVIGETGPYAQRSVESAPPGPPGIPGPNAWVALQPGYVVEVVAGGFRLPTNLAFIPNAGVQPADPFLYVTELYGTIKTVSRDGRVGTYAAGLLNFNPTGAFPGSGEQGLTGIAVHPATGDVYVTLLYEDVDSPQNPKPHYARVVRCSSADGGRTAAVQTTLLDLAGEPQGQSHQISNVTIGPDGKLYVHNGDGFDSSTPQNLDSARGKILRVNLDGSAPADNPFYGAAGGITARDYVWAYGVRNPFGGAWRASDGAHYEVENGPSTDRFAKVVAGRNFGFDGTDAGMANFASYAWTPAHAPVNLAFIQPSTFGGSGFPVSKMDHAFVTESGPTYAAGPQALGKRVVEFTLDAAGARTAGPTTLVEYQGTGRATAVGLAAGPDGLYFSDFYKDLGAATPVDAGGQILRVRYVGAAPSGGGIGLQGRYYDNPDFTQLKATRIDPTVDFDWGAGPPEPSLGADTFSVRWAGQVEAFSSEAYTFTTASDDGVRLWVNGVKLVDNWSDHAPTEDGGTLDLVAGQRYDILLEMYENGGGAVARLSWSTPTVARRIIPASRLFPPSAVVHGLKGEYYDNADFTDLKVTRTDASVAFDWGGGAPDPSMGADTFSVRWTGQVETAAGEAYTFYTMSDDGVRLWVDGLLLIDNWSDHAPTEDSGTVVLAAAGRFELVMEIYERSGGAVASLSWSTPTMSKRILPAESLHPATSGPADVVPPVIVPAGGTFQTSVAVAIATDTGGAGIRYTTDGSVPTSTSGTAYLGPFTLVSSATVRAIAFKPGLGDSGVAAAAFTITSSGGAGSGLHGAYFDNADLTNLKVARRDATVDFDWGSGSPDPAIAPDSFSVRWSGQVETAGGGTYTFYTLSDDGVRLWIDGVKLIDNWNDHAPTEDRGSIALAAGRRFDVVMELYENGGGAVASLAWSGPMIPKQTIPQGRLFPASGGGLSGEYFDTPDLSGAAVLRVDATVDFHWGNGSPDPAIAPDSFSVRWTGKVLPRHSETYTFHTISDDGVRLWVNGVLLVDNWSDHAPTEDRGTLALAVGEEYDLVLEMYENAGGAVATLSWSSSSQLKEIIPQACLRPSSGSALKGLRSVAGDVPIDGDGDSATLQAAIDAAPAGSVVVLAPLRFHVPRGLTLKAGVSLRGRASHRTILDGAGAATVLRVDGTAADGRIVIEGITVTGGTTGIDTGAADVLLRHLQVVRLGGDGILGGQAGSLEAVFLTVADNGGNGILVFSRSPSLHSLIVTGNRGFGILGAAARGSSVLANGLEADTTAGSVRFLAPASLDYREAAGSGSIDAGDSDDPFDQEPDDGGRRANQGAFGNTPEAASSEPGGGACGSLGVEGLVIWAVFAIRGRRRSRS